MSSESRHLIPSTGGRANNFDALRFVLATAVIVAHSYPIVQGSAVNEPLMRLTRGQVHMGEVSVDGFFIISGFLVTQSWLRSAGAWDYLKKRLLRIVPGFVAVVFFCTFVVGPIGSRSSSDYWTGFRPGSFIRGLVGLYSPGPPAIVPVFQNLPYPNSLNGSLWTIRPEFLCYLLVAGLGILHLLGRPAVVGTALLGMLGVLGWGGYQGMSLPVLGLLDEWPRLAECFLVGVAFFTWRDRLPRSLALFVACVVAIAIAARIPGTMRWVLPLPLGYLLFFLAYSPAVNLHEFARRGDFSYGVYLYAFPVQQLLVQQFGSRLTPITLSLAAFPPTLFLAILSWHCVEKPFLALKSTTRQRPVEVAVAASH